MKKIAIIFLVFIYGLSSIGVAVQGDYCCNKLKSLHLILSDYSKDKESCCKEKYQSLKVKDTHVAPNAEHAPALHFTFIHTLNYSFRANDLAYEKSDHFLDIHAPPLYPTTPVYLSNCVFRI